MKQRSKHTTTGKASFDHIYDREDPRQYLATLRGLDYRTPHYAQPIILALVAARGGHAVTVTDLCCSYGIIAALIKYHLTLDDLYERYASAEVANLTSDELADADELFYKDHRVDRPPRVVGVDVAARAVAYALRVGLLDDGGGENLETADSSPGLAEAIAPTDIVTVSGGVGYITTRTFGRVLDCVRGDRPAWVAAFPLRSVPYEPIAARLERYGLVTERLETTFPQRRFADAEERDHVLTQLAERGINPTGREADGFHHAQLYLSRPREDVEAAPIATLLAGQADPT